MALVGDRVPAGLQGRRRAVVAGMLAAEAHEQPLAQWLRAQLGGIAGVTLYGPPEARAAHLHGVVHGGRLQRRRGLPPAWPRRPSSPGTVTSTPTGWSSGSACWSAAAWCASGLAPYNTADELERLVAAVQELAGGAR